MSNFLLYVVLFLLPLQTRWIIQAGALNDGPWEYGTISLYITDILIIAAFVAHILTNAIFLRPGKIVYRWLLVALLAFLIVSLPFSIAPLLSAVKIATLCVSILLVYTLAKSPTPFRANALAFVLGAAVSGALGIWQFISQKTIASKWFGLAFHDPSVLGTSVVEAVAPDGVLERWLRAYGSLDHPNMFGGLMAVGLILASWLWLSRRTAKNNIEYSLTIASTVILVAGLTVSFSRSAWIAAAIGLIIILFSHLRGSHRSWKESGAWAATIILIIGLIFSQYHYLFTPRLTGDTRLEQISENERLDAGYQSLKLIKQKPLLGFGAGTYTLAVSQEIKSTRPSWFYQPVHNVFLLMAAEIGLAGTALFLAALAFLLFFIWRARKTPSAPLVIALPVAMLAISLFDHWPFSLHFGIVCCGALLGLIANHARSESLTVPGDHD